MLRNALIKEVSSAAAGGVDVKLVEPDRSENGDFSTNVAFQIAKKMENPPVGGSNDIAEELAHKLRSAKSDLIDRADSIGGFVNIWIKDSALIRALDEEISFQQEKKKINLEFVSANPTGPLTMANGRGGFYGDALANVLTKTGHNVTREYYVNDAGNQVRLLGESIEAAEGRREAKGEYYKGKYIKELVGKSAEEAVRFLFSQIKNSLEKAGIKFDVWFSEKTLRENNDPEKVLKFLEEKRWIETIGVDPDRLKIIIMQLVKLISGGKEVRMSKRAGEFVTMDDLLEEISVDVARWFFLERAPSTHMDFDLDLAKERSEKNPVYYVQYAFVRMQSILEKAGITNYELLITKFGNQAERALALKILRYSELIEDISKNYQVHRLTTYAYELAQTFSAFYRDVKVIGSEREAELLYLVSKTKETLGDVLKTLGISQPEKM